MPTASQASLRTSIFLLAALSLWLPACAQQAERAARSVVSGHVVCADTNAPARLARVTLNRLESVDAKAAGEKEAARGATTDMDGAFSIAEVPAGRYLVLAELTGYVSGISGLDTEAREHLKDAALTPPEGSTVIEVSNGLAVTADVTLERGASVSGTIRYDDGSPAIGILVGLERKNRKGAWEPALQSTLQNFSFFATTEDGSEATDSAGRFRIEGVPAGEYIVHAHLPPQTITTPVDNSGTLKVYEHPGVQLDLYNGGVFWRNEAKAIRLDRGEDVDEEMEVPLGKLRTVSGTVVDAADGHAVNMGTVTLSPEDDPEDARSVDVEQDGSFRFLYVPTGDYNLKANNAADGTISAMPNAPSALQVDIHHSYGSAEATLHVGEEAVSVTLPVPERETQPAQ